MKQHSSIASTYLIYLVTNGNQSQLMASKRCGHTSAAMMAEESNPVERSTNSIKTGVGLLKYLKSDKLIFFSNQSEVTEIKCVVKADKLRIQKF